MGSQRVHPGRPARRAPGDGILPRIALLAVALARTTAAAEPESFARFPGGGPAGTDCMIVAEVAGVAAARAARCTDGDAACDADGLADGTCVFRVRLCLDADAAPRCHPDVVTEAAITSTASAFAALAAALEVVPMPVSTVDTCTTAVAVPVATRGHHPGRLRLRAGATMASGHADRDRVALVCRARRPATFATIERTIFAPSCATASCHGAGGAGGLGLAPGAAYADLVGVPPANPEARAAGLLRVAPGDPEGSFLLRKLTGTLAPAEGEPMPRVGSPLPAAAIDLVRRWIAAGAPAVG